MMMNTGNTPVFSEHGLLTTIACDADGQPTYALEGSVFSAGSAVQWLRDALGIIQSPSETEALALSLKDNGGVYMVPAFSGLGAPYWEMEARASINGLTASTGRAHLARAALESIAYQSRDVFEIMRREAQLDLAELRVDGGAATNNFLLQFQADQLKCPLVRGSHLEMTALGAALLAGHALEFWNKSKLNKTRQQNKTIFRPSSTNGETIWSVCLVRLKKRSPSFLFVPVRNQPVLTGKKN